MYLAEYSDACIRTWAERPAAQRLQNAMLGVAGETGEVLSVITVLAGAKAGGLAEMIKKWLFHAKAKPSEPLAGELGDVLYYIAMYAQERGWSLEEVVATISVPLASMADKRINAITWEHVQDLASTLPWSEQPVGASAYELALRLMSSTGQLATYTLNYRPDMAWSDKSRLWNEEKIVKGHLGKMIVLVVAMAKLFDLSVEQIAMANIVKLKERPVDHSVGQGDVLL